MQLEGKTVIITGGGRGIGRAVALDAAKAGCNVVIVSRTEKELTVTAGEIWRATGLETLALELDLSVAGNIDRLLQAALLKFGTVDVLVNNAAVMIPKPFLEATEEEYDRTLGIDLKVPFLLAQKVLRIMMQQCSGYIINISSTAALTVPPGLAAYGIAKKGLIGLSEALYSEGAKYGVKVSTVLPGITGTEMVRGFFSEETVQKSMKPEDISYCVMFLLNQSDRMIVKEITPWATGV
jgi:3-oxoacyl-[acyl-carrier protein] reductase